MGQIPSVVKNKYGWRFINRNGRSMHEFNLSQSMLDKVGQVTLSMCTLTISTPLFVLEDIIDPSFEKQSEQIFTELRNQLLKLNIEMTTPYEPGEYEAF